MGFENRKPTSGEMETMRALLREALEDGAFAMSTGLIYPPGCYADTEELAELCKELVPYGAFYATHMREEGEQVVEAVKEAIEICERSGAPLEISHHKVTQKISLAGTLQNDDRAHRSGKAQGTGRQGGSVSVLCFFHNPRQQSAGMGV